LIDLNCKTYLILFLFFTPLIAFNQVNSTYTLKILGVVQDGGLPHLGSDRICCEDFEQNRYVTSIMLINNETNESYLFDASPDINKQLNFMGKGIKKNLKGIFLTHAHIGHYTGLMYFGREALNSKLMKVYAMPRMKKFLEQNGPWSQLVSLENISITELNNNSNIVIDSNVTVQPIEVPHRAEFSETVGYKIYGPNKTALFIPDIDKWYLWEKSIVDEIENIDYVLIDATFYDSKEVNYRDLSEIPHPFVVESIELFDSMKYEERNKIFFIHLNHTNPLLDKESDQYKFVKEKGYNVAEEGLNLKL
jgi:pyrroloquinoline quinone biosynthesis protein B